MVNKPALPLISYKQPLFVREELVRRWGDRHQFVRTAGELEAFIDIVSRRKEISGMEVDRQLAMEALDFYNKVVADGRYIWQLRERGEEAARELGVKVSKPALDLVVRAAGVTMPREAGNDVTIVVAVVIVIACAAKPGDIQEIVIDHSQAVELKM